MKNLFILLQRKPRDAEKNTKEGKRNIERNTESHEFVSPIY